MPESGEFQVVADATEKAHHVRSVCVFGTVRSGASDYHRSLTGTSAWIRSLRYAGIKDDDTLNDRDVIL